MPVPLIVASALAKEELKAAKPVVSVIVI